nr:hypothetical protein [Coralloluteibacterium stylophorae]
MQSTPGRATATQCTNAWREFLDAKGAKRRMQYRGDRILWKEGIAPEVPGGASGVQE